MEHFDQILIDEHLATEEQINEARERSRLLGGTLDEHLFRLGHVGKTDLLKTLARRYECESVDPAAVEITDQLAGMIPAEIAWQLRVLPISFDPSTQMLRVAAASPSDEELRHALTEALPQYHIEYLVTLRSALDCKLIEVYRTAAIAPPEKRHSKPPRASFLMLTSYPEADQYLAMALSAEENRVVVIDTLEEAMSEIDAERFSAILIRDADTERYRPFIDRCRMFSVSTPVRFYTSLSELTGLDIGLTGATQLLSANLRLFAGLVASDTETPPARTVPMGDYVERICRQMNLPPHDRMLVTNAAYLCDLARLYLGDSQTPDWREAFAGLGGKGEAPVFPPPVIDMLRAMSASEPSRYPDRLPLEALGGNILKLADYYLRRWPDTERLSLKQFDTVRQHLRDRAGTMFLPEVVEAFLLVLHFDGTASSNRGNGCDVLLYAPDGRDTLMLGPCFENLGFEVLIAESLESFVQIYETAWPDFLVLQAPGSSEEAAGTVEAVVARGVMIERVPTFLLAESAHVNDLHFLLQSGVEDIIPLDGDIDPLLVKMTRIRTRRETEQRDRLMVIQNIGTHGSLEDMNTIDLLQAMGHSQKTVRISVTGRGRQLTMFLDRGTLAHAVCDDLVGADAVYEGIGWRTGVWSVDPIDPEDLPDPNVFEPIDSILIEGCRQLDESSRNIPTVDSSDPFFDPNSPDSLF